MSKLKIFILITLCLFLLDCSKKESYQINLRWNKSYPEDTIENNVIGLQWCLSFLGSTIANDSISQGLTYNDSLISLDINKLGFSKASTSFLAKLNYELKNSQEYKKTNTVDLGRFMALTIGSSYHYYRIVDIPEKLDDYYSLYEFDSIQGYINHSSVSYLHRIISYSNNNPKKLKQGFISAEIDSISRTVLEYETMEVMPNGQLKFGIYDANGQLKGSANPDHTKAGKPAKCMWCHEVNIQPLFSDQRSFNGFLDYLTFNDSLEKFNQSLQKKQDSLWVDEAIRNKKLHTLMEIAYISFMEPSIKRLSQEWSMPVDKVKNKVKHFATHRHHEFDYLGNLYRREDIDKIAPWKTIEVPTSIRDESVNELNLLR